MTIRYPCSVGECQSGAHGSRQTDLLYRSTLSFVLDEERGREMATTATMDTNTQWFIRLGRYSSAVHGYQRKVTAWTLNGPHLDLTERIVE
jgi:hypothetical protein